MVAVSMSYRVGVTSGAPQAFFLTPDGAAWVSPCGWSTGLIFAGMFMVGRIMRRPRRICVTETRKLLGTKSARDYIDCTAPLEAAADFRSRPVAAFISWITLKPDRRPNCLGGVCFHVDALKAYTPRPGRNAPRRTFLIVLLTFQHS